MIGHMKTDGPLARCPLNGMFGETLHAVLCGCGHNIRLILALLRAFVAEILRVIVNAIAALMPTERHSETHGALPV